MSTRKISEIRAQIESLQLVLGAPLLGIRDFVRKERNQFIFKTSPMPPMSLFITHRQTVKEKISLSVLSHIKESLRKKERNALLVNVKGWARGLVCTKCQTPVLCRNCKRPVSVRDQGEGIQCNFCGLTDDYPLRCQVCGNTEFYKVGEGIKQFIDELKKYFPRVPVVEFTNPNDSNSLEKLVVTTEKILSFPQERIDHLFVLNIDWQLAGTSLNGNWEALDMMMQFKAITKKISVQTFYPEHRLWKALSKATTRSFYAEEINERRRYQLPPFSEQIRIITSANSEKEVIDAGKKIIAMVRTTFPHWEVSEPISYVARDKKIHGEIVINSIKRITSPQKKELRQLLPPSWFLFFDWLTC